MNATVLGGGRASLDFARSRRGRLVMLLGSGLLASFLIALAIRHFIEGSWPLAKGNPALIVAAGLVLLLGYVLKALGWRRLFPAGQRPHSLALAAAGGGAAVAGVALPGRFDEAVRVAIVRRHRGCPASVRVLCLSLVVLGLIDSAALVPLASVGAAFSGHSAGMQSGLALVAAAGVAAAALVVALPRLAAGKRVLRFRVGRWLSPRTTPLRHASEAWALVLASWVARALALFLLLGALGLGLSFPRAIVFLCAGAAAAVLPIGPAGAATQVGAGAAILAASGVGASPALDFALSAQALGILAGGAIVISAVLWRTGAAGLRWRRRSHDHAQALYTGCS